MSLLGPLGVPFADGGARRLARRRRRRAGAASVVRREVSATRRIKWCTARAPPRIWCCSTTSARTGCGIVLTTEDGSAPAGYAVEKGRVTDALKSRLPTGAGARVLTCGPNAMMRAVVELARAHAVPCLVSVEGEMACGIGVCLGCALPLTDGTRPFAYACVDGPVFDAAKVVIP